MTLKPTFALAALVGFVVLTLIFWAWRAGGLAIMQLNMSLC
ncbi:hypothetical protein Pstr01_25230 [Pseudomonas straminea]|uniref:Uncharacterized protein n=1 Tax=Pseudomonas straminea TaxID=47882 RepID=A0A1I1URQ0_PSEOC|nr:MULTISPECIES: hypothetical protein [Pseudomonas]TWD99318.1 hypothetical protein FB481_114106 [Pseudomonas sp. AG1028]GLX14284.1 hypothetical protein Pstr01_25230 [Pseudomonas straminea]SFD72338.1 hypothetical protein SAMN05216372_103478 [Pseudomonas straminea]